MKVAGNWFLPKNMKEGDKYPAIIVGHPMGAVKEQSKCLDDFFYLFFIQGVSAVGRHDLIGIDGLVSIVYME